MFLKEKALPIGKGSAFGFAKFCILLILTSSIDFI